MGPLTSSELEVALRDFLGALREWIRGEVADEAEVFDARLGSGMHPDVVLVMPSGASLGYDDWATAVRESHGANTKYDVRLTELRGTVLGGDHGLVTCNEWQINALTGPSPLNGRFTTVVYARDAEGLRMIHVQQTWLPREVVAAELGGG